MIFAEVDANNVLLHVLEDVSDNDFNPQMLHGSKLISFPDSTDVSPGMIWDGQQLLPPPPPPLADVKLRAKHDVIQFVDDVANRPDIAGTFPISEKEGWPVKLEAARAYKAGTADDQQTGMLQAEADILGVPVSAVADGVIANGSLFSKLSATIAGIRRKAFAAIDAAPDAAAVEAALEHMRQEVEDALAQLMAEKP